MTSWNAGAERIKGYTAERDHRPALLHLLSAEATSLRGWPQHELRSAAEARPLRGRRLAPAQGRLALLGQRRHHRARRPDRGSCAASPRSRATSPSGAATRAAAAERGATSACWSTASRTTRSSCSTADGRVPSWNAGAERMQGYSADEVIGAHVSLFYTAARTARAAGRQTELAVARTERGSLPRTRAGACGTTARRFWADVSITALRDDATAAARLRADHARPDRAAARRGAGERGPAHQRVHRDAGARAAQPARADRATRWPARARLGTTRPRSTGAPT